MRKIRKSALVAPALLSSCFDPKFYQETAQQGDDVSVVLIVVIGLLTLGVLIAGLVIAANN